MLECEGDWGSRGIVHIHKKAVLATDVPHVELGGIVCHRRRCTIHQFLPRAVHGIPCVHRSKQKIPQYFTTRISWSNDALRMPSAIGEALTKEMRDMSAVPGDRAIIRQADRASGTDTESENARREEERSSEIARLPWDKEAEFLPSVFFSLSSWVFNVDSEEQGVVQIIEAQVAGRIDR